jgi:membrane protein
MQRKLGDTLRRANRLAARALSTWFERGGLQLGASISFYSIFALAPLLIVAIAVAGLAFGEEAVRGRVVEELGGLLGTTAATAIEALIASAWRPGQGTFAGVIGVATLLIAASGVLVELKRALNVMLDRAVAPRSVVSAFVRARLTAFAMVLGFGFLTIVSLLLSTAVAAVAAYLPARFPQLKILLTGLDLVASLIVLTTAFAALIRWLPDRPPGPRVTAISAVTAALLFTLGKYLVGLYLARAAVVSTYGAAGSLVVLIIWVYYTSQVLLVGVAFGRQFEPGRRAEAESAAAASWGKTSSVEGERAGST